MKATIPAWVGDDYLNLSQVLALIGENEYVWLLADFDGLTLPDAASSASQLEERNREGQGVEFNWKSLMDFAGQVHQMVDGRLSARATSNPGEVVVLALEAFDSSEWIIEASDGNDWALEALSRVTTLAS